MDGSKDVEITIAAFFELTPDLVCMAGRDGFFRKVNHSVIEKLGYTEDELMARPISTLMHPEDREQTLQKREELLKGKALVNFQNRYVKKSGEIIWLEWTSIYFSDNQVILAIAKDITERKQMELGIEENYRKFKNLTTHFKSRIEEDRRNLANELHEELVQLASILKLDIEWIGKHAPDWSPSSRSRIEHALVVSNQLIKTIRRISFSISPNMLEHLGLNATLEWHCKEFSLLNGIPCQFETTLDDSTITDEIRIDLFRICQEALTNIMTHAEASHVSVTIGEKAGEMWMTIRDDGKGFVVEQQKRKPGLVRMRERAASINGHLTIQSQEGEGTAICVTVGR